MSTNFKNSFSLSFLAATLLCGAFSVLLLAGCNVEKSPRKPVNWDFVQVCADGVVYYTFRTSLAPAYNQDGTLKKC